MPLDEQVLDRRTLSAQVYSQLEQKVLSGALPPGTRLSEECIAETFSVSRSPAREALLELERVGFAIRDGSRDRMVAIPTREMIAERYEMWWIVDIGRTYLASLQSTPEDIAELRSFLDRAVRAVKSRDSRRFRTASEKFHEKIRRGCRNSFVNEAGSACNLVLRWFEALYDRSPEMSEQTIEEHTQILDAYERKDLGALAVAIQGHTARTRERILKCVDGPEAVAND